MISQGLRVVPPTDGDSKLIDFSGIIQRNLVTLFQAGHTHVGQNGVLSAFPAKTDGQVGDILIAVVSGSAYLCFKVSSSQWYRLGPATAL